MENVCNGVGLRNFQFGKLQIVVQGWGSGFMGGASR